eukprot:5792315-Pyramimonas_sp.AAC.1
MILAPGADDGGAPPPGGKGGGRGDFFDGAPPEGPPEDDGGDGYQGGFGDDAGEDWLQVPDLTEGTQEMSEKELSQVAAAAEEEEPYTMEERNLDKGKMGQKKGKGFRSKGGARAGYYLYEKQAEGKGKTGEGEKLQTDSRISPCT